MPGDPIQRIPQPRASGLENNGLLGLINMPHFGRLNEGHACVKKILACFHGGMLWLNVPIPITVDFIVRIMGMPKAGEDPTHYIRGRDTDKKLSKKLKERFVLQNDGCSYCINNINSLYWQQILFRGIDRSSATCMWSHVHKNAQRVCR